jgi:lipopolysaccharide transport system ATP-binding protein
MAPILEVRDLSKKYRIGHSSAAYLSLREQVSGALRFNRVKQEDFWALKDIDFNIEPGLSLGIIGRNGAGKSTLLKILSRITPPTTGKITTRGRIASLLEVGTGFHPELTGRENIFFNGSLLGMKRHEIESKFDEIVDFSGTEQFLDTALKHYSSGMQLRLAFAVAAFLEPEILIIDEVLAVGDAEFQKKCLGKMASVAKSGRTILFVSHNLAAVENLCTKAILLDRGNLMMQGTVIDTLKKYQSLFEAQNNDQYVAGANRSEDVYFKSVKLSLRGRQPNHTLLLECQLTSKKKHKDVFVAFDISNSIGVNIMQAIPNYTPFIRYSEAEQPLTFEIDLPPLIPDVYKVSAWLGSHNTETLVWDKEIVSFEITEAPTQGRTFPYSHQNGFLVPTSRIING